MKIDILGISELKWTGMGEFNSNDHYISYCGQESLRRNGIALIVNQRILHAVLGCKLKKDRMISVHFQGIISFSTHELNTLSEVIGMACVYWENVIKNKISCKPKNLSSGRRESKLFYY